MNHLWCRFCPFLPQRRALFSTSHRFSVLFRLPHDPLQDVEDADVVNGHEGGEVGGHVDPFERRSRRVEGLQGLAFLHVPPLASKQETLILTELEKRITTHPLEAAFYHIQTHTHSPPPTRFPSWAILFNLSLKLTFPVRAASRRDASSKARRVHRSLATAAI